MQTSQISLGMHAPCTAETSRYAHSIMQLDVAVIPGLPHTLIFGFGYVTIRRIIGPDVNTRINTHSVNTFLHRNNGNRR